MEATSHKNLVDRAHAFYMDWEAGCNLSEDEFGGCIFGWKVREFMSSVGWTTEEIDRKDDFFVVYHLASALKKLANRGTHHDTNPTRRVVYGNPMWAEADQFWSRYIKSADDSVRRIAEGGLRDAGVSLY